MESILKVCPEGISLPAASIKDCPARTNRSHLRVLVLKVAIVSQASNPHGPLCLTVSSHAGVQRGHLACTHCKLTAFGAHYSRSGEIRGRKLLHWMFALENPCKYLEPSIIDSLINLLLIGKWCMFGGRGKPHRTEMEQNLNTPLYQRH